MKTEDGLTERADHGRVTPRCRPRAQRLEMRELRRVLSVSEHSVGAVFEALARTILLRSSVKPYSKPGSERVS